MAVIVETPTNPAIGTLAAPVAAGLASTFRPALNTYVGAVETKAAAVCAFLEKLQGAIGNAALSGGAITAGSGLSVSVAAFSALVGTVIETNAAAVVGGLTMGATNSLFLRQDGAFTTNTTGTLPAAADGHGAALLWGTATTNAVSVTAVSNVRRTFAQNLAALPVFAADPAGAIDGDAWLLENGGTHQLGWRAGGVVYHVTGT